MWRQQLKVWAICFDKLSWINCLSTKNKRSNVYLFIIEALGIFRAFLLYSVMENTEQPIELTAQEKDFCNLFVNGIAPYCGNAQKCYEAIYGAKPDASGLETVKPKKLLSQKQIRNYIEELSINSIADTKHLKMRLTENLLKIADECATAEYSDRRGIKLSPAPLRSVSVQATKAIMDMHGIKEAQVNKLNIEGAGEGGIVFNIVVPEKQNKEEL